MNMDAITLNGKLNYLGMERDMRKLLIEEGIKKAEDVAIMTSVETCDALLEHYEVVSCENECVTIIKHEDVKTYNSMVKYLKR